MYLEPGSMAWHRERQRGIGGSDLAAMFGVSNFESPLGLWELKTNRRLYNEGNALTRRGTRLEPYVCRRFEEESGVHLVAAPQFVRHPRWDAGVKLLANPDRLMTGRFEGWIFEAKTTTAGGFTHRMYERGELPPHHSLQLQHYAISLGAPGGIISCLVCPSAAVTDPDTQCRVIYLKWQRCDRVASLIEESVSAWWSRYVDGDEPPAYDRHPRAMELLEGLSAERWIDEYPQPGGEHARP